MIGAFVSFLPHVLWGGAALGIPARLWQALGLLGDPLVMSFAYAIGLGPAMAYRLFGAWIARWIHSPGARIAAAPAIGFAATSIGLGVLLLATGSRDVGYGLEASALLAGAGSALICTAVAEGIHRVTGRG